MPLKRESLAVICAPNRHRAIELAGNLFARLLVDRFCLVCIANLVGIALLTADGLYGIDSR